MAFADKVTHMNLATIITNPRTGYNGNVLYEGVLIEGIFLLKKVSSLTTEILTIEENKMDNWLEEYSAINDTDVVLVFLGQGGEFVPRTTYLKNNKEQFDFEDDIRLTSKAMKSQVENFEGFTITFKNDNNIELSIDKDEEPIISHIFKLPKHMRKFDERKQISTLNNILNYEIKYLIE